MYTRVMSHPAMALHGSEAHPAGPTAYDQGHGTDALVLSYMQALAQPSDVFFRPPLTDQLTVTYRAAIVVRQPGGCNVLGFSVCAT
jgi:hypothetical protein